MSRQTSEVEFLPAQWSNRQHPLLLLLWTPSDFSF